MKNEVVNEEISIWIRNIVNGIVSQIFQTVVGIGLKTVDSEHLFLKGRLPTFYMRAEGDFNIDLMLQFEPYFFVKVVSLIKGEEVVSFDEAIEYGLEGFNIIGGRLISEICRKTGKKTRLSPPEYIGEANFNSHKNYAHIGYEYDDGLQVCVLINTDNTF